MKKVIEQVTCDNCGKNITDLPYVQLDDNFESMGIWLGDIGRWIQNKGETFCSLDCFIQWLKDEHNRIYEAMNNDE